MRERRTSNRVSVENTRSPSRRRSWQAGWSAVLAYLILAAAPVSADGRPPLAPPVSLDATGYADHAPAPASRVAVSAGAPVGPPRSDGFVGPSDRVGRRAFAVAAMAGVWALLALGLARVRARSTPGGCGEV